MVVLIHTTAFIRNQDSDTFLNYHIYRQVLEVAVPFFFMVTGYVLFARHNEYALKYALNIFAIYISSTLFYICYKIGIMCLDKIYLSKDFTTLLAKEFSTYNIQKFINGTLGYFHLWYLVSTVVAVLFIFLLRKYKRSTLEIFSFSLVIYILTLTNFIDWHDLVIYGGFSKALFYISLGMLITKLNKETIQQPLLKFSFVIILFTIFKYFTYVNFSEILLMLASFYLFVFATKENGKKTKFASLSQYTLGIYVLHVFVYRTVYKIFEYKGYDQAIIQNDFGNLVLLNIGTIIICVLLYKPLNFLFFKPIEKLIKNEK